jgi:hypothetical protein
LFEDRTVRKAAMTFDFAVSFFSSYLSILDIGDRIALSNVDDDTDPTGSLGWIVEGMFSLRCS